MMTTSPLIRSAGTEPGSTETLSEALVWLLDAGVMVHPKVIVERYPDGGRSFAQFLSPQADPARMTRGVELANVATYCYGMKSVMTQPGAEGAGRNYGIAVNVWHDIGADLVPLLLTQDRHSKALENARSKAKQMSEEDPHDSIAIYAIWREADLMIEACNMNRYPGFKDLRESSGMRPIRIEAWTAGDRLQEDPNTVSGLNAIADLIAPAEQAWHDAFSALTTSDKTGAETWADLVAATQQLNAATDGHIPEIARLTGNAESTLRSVYCRGDEIAAHFGGSAAIPGFGPSHMLRMVAKYRSFNTDFWDSQGYEFPWKSRDEFSRNVVDSMARGEAIPHSGSVAVLTRHQYSRMKLADEMFQVELERVYGQKGAADGRYRFAHDDQVLQRAADEFVSASDSWTTAVRRARDAVPIETAPDASPKATRRHRP